MAFQETTRAQVEAAVARYRELTVGGELSDGGVAHWEACRRAAAAFGLTPDQVHHLVRFSAEEGW